MAPLRPRGDCCSGGLAAAKDSRLWRLLTVVLAVSLAVCGLGVSLALARLGSAGAWELEANSPGIRRRLQTAATSAENWAPTLDDVDWVIFSRPPYSLQDRSELVYFSMGSIYVLCAVVLFIGFNLDRIERRRRIERSIVPHETSRFRICCCRCLAHKESVPCEIAEQYYLDARLLRLQSDETIAERRLRMKFFGYLVRRSYDFVEALTRKHLFLSLLLRTIPTFTRAKRAFLIVVQCNVCMLTAAVAMNVREHNAPLGRYELFWCDTLVSSDCLSTVPWALIAGAALCPLFTFTAVRQMRLTCFVMQTHPSTSRFPLGVRKFAKVPPRTLLESLWGSRNRQERQRERVEKSRSCTHRLVHLLWRTTRPSVNDLRFHDVVTSWAILLLMIAVVGGTAAYLVEVTVFLKDQVVYHWLAWSLTMFFSSVLILEPMLILWTDLIWCAFVDNLSQHWAFGANSLAATTRYKGAVRQIEEVYVAGLREVAAVRIQQWWMGLLESNRAIHEQAGAAVKIQALRKKMNPKRRYVKDARWCLKVEVRYCSDLRQANGMSLVMNPLVRLMCDRGNPNVLETKIASQSGGTASFEETFFADIKDSKAMYVAVWAKGLISEEFVGRGYFDFNDFKTAEGEAPDGHSFQVPLYNIEHGERVPVRPLQHNGLVELRVFFLDPLKEPCGADGKDDWMLPKNRMKFALSKVAPDLSLTKALGDSSPTGTGGRPPSTGMGDIGPTLLEGSGSWTPMSVPGAVSESPRSPRSGAGS